MHFESSLWLLKEYKNHIKNSIVYITEVTTQASLVGGAMLFASFLVFPKQGGLEATSVLAQISSQAGWLEYKGGSDPFGVPPLSFLYPGS